MRLRIYRTFEWKVDNPEKRLGGQLHYMFVSKDTLQSLEVVDDYGNGGHEAWIDVPVVEANKPEHPKR